MDIVCEQCQAKFKIPDDKIPPGKVVSIACPKCKSKITVGAARKPEPPAQADASDVDALPANAYDAADKPFDFVEEEGKTALVCLSDAAEKKALMGALEKMEYHLTDAADGREALRNMRYHMYDLVAVDEAFDSAEAKPGGVLDYLERLPMAVRRSIFVTLISRTHRTLDNMMAFNRSVNLVLNVKNIADAEKILSRAITENDFFYRIYKETLRKLGKI